MAKTYLYQPDKKIMKQGAVLTDESGNTVYLDQNGNILWNKIDLM